MDGQEQPKPGNSELNGGGRSGWRGDRAHVPEYFEPCVSSDMYRVRFSVLSLLDVCIKLGYKSWVCEVWSISRVSRLGELYLGESKAKKDAVPGRHLGVPKILYSSVLHFSSSNQSTYSV